MLYNHLPLLAYLLLGWSYFCLETVLILAQTQQGAANFLQRIVFLLIWWHPAVATDVLDAQISCSTASQSSIEIWWLWGSFEYSELVMFKKPVWHDLSLVHYPAGDCYSSTYAVIVKGWTRSVTILWCLNATQLVLRSLKRLRKISHMPLNLQHQPEPLIKARWLHAFMLFTSSSDCIIQMSPLQQKSGLIRWNTRYVVKYNKPLYLQISWPVI